MVTILGLEVIIPPPDPRRH